MIGGQIAKVFEHVRGTPGVTAAELAEAFGFTVPVAGANLRALRTMKYVTSRGNTRGTRYFARPVRRLRGPKGEVRYTVAAR